MTTPTSHLTTLPPYPGVEGAIGASQDKSSPSSLPSNQRGRWAGVFSGIAVLSLLVASGCSSDSSGPSGGGAAGDSGVGGAGGDGSDAGQAGADAMGGEGGSEVDGGTKMPPEEAGTPEAGTDAGSVDSGADAAADAGGPSDAGGGQDASEQDTGTNEPGPDASDAGGGGDAGSSIFFAAQRAYDRLNPEYDTPEQCQFNCYQKLDFCPDGTMYIVVSDIVYPGSYSRLVNTIGVSLPAGELFEISGEFDFVIQENDTLVETELGPRVWNRSKNLDPFFCGQFE